jgi:hypothetical protein
MHTGDSVQIELEGQWDETISIDDIHKGVIDHMIGKLEVLKNRYNHLKTSNNRHKDNLLKKIVAARIHYQRYVNVTKDIMKRCNEFIRTRRDTPGTRIAFLRNVQEYFAQAKDFVKLDISLKKISPSLLTYVQINPRDSPKTYHRKRELCRALATVVKSEKNSLAANGIGKMFRSRYAQQSRFINQPFPQIWKQYVPIVLRNSLKDVEESDECWLRTILYIFSKHCSVNYIQQGYCPGCLFPIINERSEGTVGGKLFCPACKKEIEWTYYMNPRTICLIFESFHRAEIENAKQTITGCIDADPFLFVLQSDGKYFEEILDEYLTNSNNYINKSINEREFECDITTTVDDIAHASAEDPSCDLSLHDTHAITDRESVVSGNDDDDSFPTFNDVCKTASVIITRVYGQGSNLDVKVAKETYRIYKAEILSFEGKVEDSLPRGIIPRVERYVCHHHNLPPKEEVRKRPLNAKGDREGTTKKMIYDSLMELNIGKYSNLVSKLSNKIWKSALPDIHEHYHEIIAECIVQREVFNRLSKQYGRKTNINQRVILMFISQRYGYPWTDEDFKVSFSLVTRKKQIKILEEIFQIIYPSQEV